MLGWRGTAVAAMIAGCAGVAAGGGPDPRTAQGQLAACGGLWNWQRIGYIEFTVAIEDRSGSVRDWHYHWDRRNSLLRLTGDGPDGVPVDVVLEIRSRTGGGWRGGELAVGEPLADLVAYALARWDQDLAWLAFPLTWAAPGVTVWPGPAGPGGSDAAPTRVETPTGAWDVWLNEESGLIARTVRDPGGEGQRTIDWVGWEEHGGVSFARRRVIAETGESIEVSVLRVGPEAPPDAF
ncbi:MAG: hypothetical protein ACOY3Y_04295 [Acidobacteriota bacterium]